MSETNNLLDPFDLAIIGAGSGGVVAAPFAARAGARVALIEKHRIGGDCTWTGCVPSKALLKAAKVAHSVRVANTFGLAATLEPVNLKRVMDYVRAAIQTVYAAETPEVLRHEGVDVFLAEASFVDAHTLSLLSENGERQTLSAKHILICTGGRAALPDIPGLREVPYITNETVFDMETLPQHLLVLGGGPIGLEMAQAFRRLGSEVTVLQSGARLLPKDEPEASDVLVQCLRAEGLTVHLNTRVTRATQAGDEIVLDTAAGPVSGDALLVAVGRRPNVESLKLQNAGVNFSEKGLPVDEHLRTNIRHIYAAGDVIGGPQFTHVAGFQAFTAARNALFPGASRGVSEHVPWTTFTEPEVAHCGMSEAEARQQYGDAVLVRTKPMTTVDRAVTESDVAGFIKVILKDDGTVLGATVVAERAGEIIHEWILAIEQGWKLNQLAGAMHVYPTYAIANQQLASDYAVESFLNSTAAKLLNRLSGRASKL